MTAYESELKATFGNRLLCDYSLLNYSSLRTDGVAQFFLAIQSEIDLEKIEKIKENTAMPLTFLGRGSNILFSDTPLPGLVLQLANRQKKYGLTGNIIELDGSIFLPQAIQLCQQNLLSGFEFAAGVPGTIAGSIKMNAGTKLGEISDIFLEADVFHEGKVHTLSKDDLRFAYRESALAKDAFILRGRFELKKETETSILKYNADVKEYLKFRNATQPLNKPTLGSTFVNPRPHAAAKLIQEAGLKGEKRGGISVSQKHANFIVNDGTGTGKQASELIQYIKKTVKNKFSVDLSEEIIFLGF